MKRKILITGGAGFTGINMADYFLKKGCYVYLFDNLSRKGTNLNLKWLRSKWKSGYTFVKGDVVKDRKKLDLLVNKVDAVLHFAAQVAVTHSVADPHHDFMTNAYGTLNVLEAIRNSKARPMLLYSSTNKVYGNIENTPVRLTRAGYRYPSFPKGVPEHHILDFHSPYGCSKGSADQCVRDYSRIYGLKTVVFRQSCIYGSNQFGMEDQGWVAWFVISSILGRPLTIYGDGHQVRDVLHIRDLCRLYEMTIKKIDTVSGKIYNIGGGPRAAYSVRGALSKLGNIFGKNISYSYSDWRPGDQRVYISDIRKIKKDLGWEPQISFEDGLKELVSWASAQKKTLKRIVG
jgi:CDP-paratose 2-epimerase